MAHVLFRTLNTKIQQITLSSRGFWNFVNVGIMNLFAGKSDIDSQKSLWNQRRSVQPQLRISMAIDGFRLLADPLASIAVYLIEVTTSLHMLPDVGELYLIFPRKPQAEFI